MEEKDREYSHHPQASVGLCGLVNSNPDLLFGVRPGLYYINP